MPAPAAWWPNERRRDGPERTDARCRRLDARDRADLNIDPFFGVEIWAAATFVREAIEPDTRTHLLLADAPLLEAAPASMAALRDHLLRFYAAEHDVHLIAPQTGIGPHALGGGVRTRTLAALDDPGGGRPASMLVPRIRHTRMDFERPAAAGAADR